ncbi:MAG: L-threonylcarbamoyladenylate synthase [Candidatus Buchananbacteria bacterium]|nr:L-threonylcarbamoyladenylate synthase [Candidatus Buchananbacteria bacterium]
MKVVKSDQSGISQAVKILKQGGVIVYPTDTAYALGGLFDSKRVTKNILRIKNRKDEKFTLIASSVNQAKTFFKLSGTNLKLAKKYWPGPLSIVVNGRFAVRVPANSIARRLALRAGRPLIATSANLSGGKNLYSAKAVIAEFQNQKYQPQLVIDAGNLPKIKPSTLVKVEGSQLEVIRIGLIKPKI